MAGKSVAQGWRITARAFRLAYDYMGMNMAISLFWFTFGFVPTGLVVVLLLQVPNLISVLLVALVSALILGPVTAAAYSMTTAMMQGEHVLVRDFFSRFREYYKSAALVTAALFAILAILVVDLFFFLQADAAWMRFLSIFWVYFLIFWALMAQYAYPLLVRRERKALLVLKMAALLALDNLVATLVMASAGIVFVAFSVFFRIPILLFLAGTLGFLHCVGLDELLAKYKRTETDQSIEGEVVE